MPPLETIDRYTKAVVWEATGNVDNYSRPSVQGPHEITVRWLPVNRQGTDPQGNVCSVTLELMLDQIIPINSIVWKGELVDLPLEPTDLFVVVSREEVDDIKARLIQYSASCTRFRDSLPATIGTGT